MTLTAAQTEMPPESLSQEQILPNEPKFRMAALDLDGTLLRSDHQLSQATVEYLRYLHSRGFLLMIATGRAAPSTFEHVCKLHLPSSSLPVVCSNGAKGLFCQPHLDNNNNNNNDSNCHHPLGETTVITTTTTTATTHVTVQEIFSTPVPQDIVSRTLALAKRLGHVTQYYHDPHIYANPTQGCHYELTTRYRDLTGSHAVFVNDNDYDALLQQGSLPSKLLVMCMEGDLDATMDAFGSEFGSHEATIVYGMGWFLEVLHPDVCKGHGLLHMCKALNVPIDECIAFGDGDNDLEFIQLAGKGIVMKNARDVVKQVADEVTEYTNNEDGVIRTLQRMESEGLLHLK